MIQLSEKQRAIIDHHLSTLPSMMMGKIIITFELGCGMGGVVNTLKIKKFTEEDVKA